MDLNATEYESANWIRQVQERDSDGCL